MLKQIALEIRLDYIKFIYFMYCTSCNIYIQINMKSVDMKRDGEYNALKLYIFRFGRLTTFLFRIVSKIEKRGKAGFNLDEIYRLRSLL